MSLKAILGDVDVIRTGIEGREGILAGVIGGGLPRLSSGGVGGADRGPGNRRAGGVRNRAGDGPVEHLRSGWRYGNNRPDDRSQQNVQSSISFHLFPPDPGAFIEVYR